MKTRIEQALDRIAPMAHSGDNGRSVSLRAVEPETAPELITPPNRPPAKLAPEALRGIAGEIVGRILPHTEACEAALLFGLLAGFGSQAGRACFTVAGNSKHYPNLFGVLVGTTSKGRKGTSWNCIRDLLAETDEDWKRDCVAKGLHSGEGLIHHIRDARTEMKPVKEDGRIVDYQEEIVDAGVSDKRLFVIEEEFASVLRRMKGKENSLSVILREAWDGNDLRSLVKNSPDRATEPHVSVVGHITKAEASELLTSVDCQNGFANRFLWIFTNRSKLLPDGGLIEPESLRLEIDALRRALDLARNRGGGIPLSPEARELWREIYPGLSEGKPGLSGAVLGRAEAHVLRLALVYALIEGRGVSTVENLESARALWRYSEETALWLFGTAFNHPDADRIYKALRRSPEGRMDQSAINRDVFHNHAKAEQIEEARAILEKSGAVYVTTEKTAGADKRIWNLTNRAKKAK